MNVTQGYLTRYPDIAGVFTINDPQAMGSDLAAKQLNRTNIVITSVDGAPDVAHAMKVHTQIKATASQDPYTMGEDAVQTGLNGKKPANPMILMQSKLVTPDNVDKYPGWSH
jgi:ribose transport system substrate-binding protein